MIELEAAQQRILDAIPVSPPETVALAVAQRRVLAADIASPVDLPTFDNSAMDGYAVRAEDVRLANQGTPVTLSIVGKVAAGGSFAGRLKPGECVRLFTGSPLPVGADAVVMQEDTAPHPERAGVIQVFDSAKPWENVRLRGVDVKRGDTITPGGLELTAGRLALLAATGVHALTVGRHPRVALLATGSELREPSGELAPGQIYESNRGTLAALTHNAGGVPEIFPIVTDTQEDTRRALEQAFAHNDFVVTSGGVSVGEFDFVKRAFADLGGELGFWQVAMRPGKPFVFGQWRGKFLFGLPGNPVSAFVTFLLLVRPAVRRWQGAQDVFLPRTMATLAEKLTNDGERRHFVRVAVDDQGNARPTGLQQSHALKSLAAANGLVDLSARVTLPKGTPVPVLRWD